MGVEADQPAYCILHVVRLHKLTVPGRFALVSGQPRKKTV